jgi:hypothetical protein
MATKRKMRKFAEGDYITTDPSNPVPSIDDDVRARALKYVEGASEESRDIGAPVTRSAAKSTSKVSQTVAPPTKPTPESAEDYKARMEGLVKKQGLERVEPENYIPGPGLLKGMLKSVVSKGLKTYTPEAIKQIGNQSVRQLENNATRMLPYDKAGSLAAKRAERAAMRDVEMKRGNAKNYGINPDEPGSMSALEALRKDIGGGAFAMKKGGKVKAKSSYKSGGSVSSASKRADGCAIRGKTRA